jgi:hypothetical protein
MLEKSFEWHSQRETNEGVAAEILSMAHEDQAARERWEETGEMWDMSLDRERAERLKKIVNQMGWPTRSKVGDEAAKSAWILVQHADHDTEFQKHCLELMKQEAEGEVGKEDIAFLEDRVRSNMGQPTLYGTQFDYDENGVFKELPIENPVGLDERRRQMGLGPFEDYKREILEMNSSLE